MPIPWDKIEPLLLQAAKPGRYVGGEINQIVKFAARARCCLAFPDVYEIGMSYHGFRILYERINAREGWAAERTYAPWPDFEALLRERRLPLYSLETRRALAEFDWVGFTLQHELNYTNVLNMIDLAGLPLESRERADPYPILIGGGEGAFSPEPLAPFLDAFVVGDGEDIALDLMRLFERSRAEAWDRARILGELARIPGVYVPAFYDVDYLADGRIATIRPIPQPWGEPPAAIHKRHFDIAADPGPAAPVVPLMRTVHDRLVIEIRRGCVNGCRFCQAGMINRPVHERPLEQIVETAQRGLANTGYDSLSLLSLSSADYTLIGPLTRRLTELFSSQGVSFSLPSLRINAFDVALIDEIGSVRQSGFTFAPEAGSERLRQVINKPVDQEAFFRIIDDVFRRGWRTVKFYFMIGLPTETEADLDGIVEICERAAELGRRHHGRSATVNVTLSPFVPKFNTPFQWEAQLPRDELERRFRYVRHALGRRVAIKTANIDQSLLEAVLARGDRRLGRALRRAWEFGARFDGWDEWFKFDVWLRAFEETGLDPSFYANRERAEDEIFPSEHIDADVGRRFFWLDRRRAFNGRATEKCDTGTCTGCDACDDEQGHTLAKKNESHESHESYDSHASHSSHSSRRGEPTHASPPPVARLRITFTKLGPLRYLSHLDFAKVMQLLLRRAGIPLAYTQGFNPTPRVSFAPPLSLGMGGEREMMDLMLIASLPPAYVLEQMHKFQLEGCEFIAAEEIPLRSDSLEAQIAASVYRIEFTPAAAVTPKDLVVAVDFFKNGATILADCRKKSGARTVNLADSFRALEVLINENGPALQMAISHEPGHFIKPHEAAAALLARPLELGRDLRINRTCFLMIHK